MIAYWVLYFADISPKIEFFSCLLALISSIALLLMVIIGESAKCKSWVFMLAIVSSLIFISIPNKHIIYRIAANASVKEEANER